MKVRDLIAELSAFDPELSVFIEGHGCAHPVGFVFHEGQDRVGIHPCPEADYVSDSDMPFHRRKELAQEATERAAARRPT